MGTSQSSKGRGGGSPLVPPWADDQPQQPLPSPQERRFAPFRESLGNAVSNGNRADFRKAIGHYARKASGGSSNAARRLGSVTQAGAELFGALVECLRPRRTKHRFGQFGRPSMRNSNINYCSSFNITGW